MNETINVIYKTTKGTVYPLEIGYAISSSNTLVIDKDRTVEACKKGCGLYGLNGGCPPFSPHFDEIGGNEILILYAKINTKDYPARILHGSYYTRWVFVETFMTSLTNRLGKSISRKMKGYFLSSGNCHTCRPKRCAVKDGNNCRNPIERTFSLESTGVLVTDLMRSIFNIDLQWWKRDDPSYIPMFIAKVIGIIKNDNFIVSDTKLAILEALNNERADILSCTKSYYL